MTSPRFNPTLVRLRRIKIINARPLSLGFNPTLVRLRQIVDHDLEAPEVRFNPTLVRLRLVKRQRNAPRAIFVSIPRWFD